MLLMMINFQKHKLVYLLLSLIFLASCEDKKEEEAKNEEELITPPIKSKNLMIFDIDTKGKEILDEPKILSELIISLDDDTLYNGYIGIEKRGSSSQYFYEKKQYGVETWDMNGADIDVSLAGLPKEEDWIFYAPFGDKSLIRNTLIYSLSNNMGRYASRSKFMEVNINNDYKLDNKILGNIHPSEIINFHSIKKETRNYLCILNSDGRFKKVLFDEDMIKSNRSFTITKLKNNLKTIDSFISNESKDLIILTSIGRIFKFNLSNKFLTPTSKQSQGLIIAKLLPSEKIVSCCTFNDGENIFLISKQGKIFCINSNEIYCSNEYSLGYLNEKTQLKNDYFLKIMASNHYLDIETNKNKSARLDLNKLNFKSNKSNFLIDFLKLDNDEYLENCFRLENFLD